MKDTIITAKIPYNILFEGMNQDNMCVFRILSKKKKGFDRFMSYLKGRKSEMNPDISKYKVISWLIDNSPVYIKEQEVENDYVITTVIYDYFNFRSFIVFLISFEPGRQFKQGGNFCRSKIKQL